MSFLFEWLWFYFLIKDEVCKSQILPIQINYYF